MNKEVSKPYNVFASRCPSRKTFENIFSRWGILVLVKLSEGPIRFGALRREIDGISEKMLSQTLKHLELEGLVNRKEWDEKPPRVEYSLTKPGIKLSKTMFQALQDLYEELGHRKK
ncbi:MAG: helix-turn-helix transcriptional regulator [Spirochaetaceae bacterium]